MRIWRLCLFHAFMFSSIPLRVKKNRKNKQENEATSTKHEGSRSCQIRDDRPHHVRLSPEVACPSGRRCSTRNAVWCNSHPGFKSLRYRHGESRVIVSIARDSRHTAHHEHLNLHERPGADTAVAPTIPAWRPQPSTQHPPQAPQSPAHNTPAHIPPSPTHNTSAGTRRTDGCLR